MGRTIQEDIVVAALQLLQALLEDDAFAGPVAQVHFQLGQPDMAGREVKTRRVGFVEDPCQDVPAGLDIFLQKHFIKGGSLFFRIKPQMDAGAGVGVQIHDQHPPLHFPQTGCQAQGRGGFPNAALLIGDGQDMTLHAASCCLRSSLRIMFSRAFQSSS